jgi:RHS repeat-associated protein
VRSAGGAAFKNLYGKGIDEILERKDVVRNVTFYYQQNHEGSVTHLTSTAGAIIEKYRYDAFGTPTIYNVSNVSIWPSAYGNSTMFTGRLYQNLGYYEYRARAYHPWLGRFMSEDPKLFVRGINRGTAPDDWSFDKNPGEAEFNLFRYCGNDPVDFVDPVGLEFNDPYAGSYELVPTITHPGVDRYGETELHVRPMVVGMGRDIVLKGYDVDVGEEIHRDSDMRATDS